MNKISKIESLNGIRGFAILLVLLSHASNHGMSIHPNLSFSGAGRYGVFLFFVLSAFLLTRQFLESAPKGDEIKPFITHYLLRRFLRIYPLFLASLVLYYILGGSGIFSITETDIIKSIFLLDGKSIFWTIPVEFQYYFLLPIVSLLLLRTERTSFVIITISLFVIVWWLSFPPKYVTHLIPFLPIFVLGSGVAYISHKIHYSYSNTNHKLLLRIFNFFAICSFLALIVFIPNYFNFIFSRNVVYTEFHTQFLLFSILSSILVLSVVHGDGFIKKLMETKFMVFWGDISFSAYLGHMIVLKYVKKLDVSAPLQWIIFIFIVAAMSYLAYKYFELPLSKIQNFKNFYARIRMTLR